MPRVAKTKTETIDPSRMTPEEAMRIIEQVARGEGGKQQAEAAKEWLRINGQGEVYTKYTLEVVHTYKDKPAVVIPQLVIP